jgi:hypothetical protein
MKCRWFQIHLSTAIVMMVVASFLIASIFDVSIPFRYIPYTYKCANSHYFGWPTSFAWMCDSTPFNVNWPKGIFINAISYVAILLAVSRALETFFARSRKEPQ